MSTKELTHFESLYPADIRDQEVKQALDYIRGGKSAQVVGLPGVGRSNFLQLLSYNKSVRLKHLGENQKWFHFVHMDFSEVKKRSLFEVTKFILLSIVYSLSERGYGPDHAVVNGYLKEAVNLNDELILFQALKKSIDYLAIEKELTVVLLIDRFEQYIPDIDEQFFLNLKILRNRAKYRFSVILTLSRPLEELLEASLLSEFHEYLAENIVYLRMHDPVGAAFRFSYLEKITGKTLPEEVKQQIIKLTGGHNKLLLLSYEQVLSEEQKVDELKSFLLKRKPIYMALDDLWNFLSPSEQLLIKKAITGNQKADDPALTYLENVQLLKNGYLTIPLFEEFVRQFPDATKNEALAFDSATNEIKKGDEDITERLSPSEFRLLRYLIIHQGKIIEKDDIIQAVWKDSQTQEGVTDQALDQIIYRLRKKVEDDPNNPAHIQTIKGRGVKFNA